MSIECDTSCLFGVIRLPPPPETIVERGKRPKSEQEPEPVPEKKRLPENLDERGKQPKSEPEPEEKQKPVQKQREKAAWELKALEDLTLSDFSMYDDAVKPFSFACTRFKYSNKAMIKKEKEIKAASADYIKRSRNLSPFDAIAPPKITMEFGRCWVAVPLTMTDDRRLQLTPLCKAALDKFNADNQMRNDAKFVFLDVVKTTWRPGGIYYITFQAQDDSPNCSVATFQAMVRKKRTGPHEVKSCDIKI